MGRTLAFSPDLRGGRYVLVGRKGQPNSFSFCVGHEHCLPNYRIDRRALPFWVLELIVGGRGWLELAGNAHELEAGMIFAYGPDRPHRFGSDPQRPLQKYFLLTSQPTFPAGWTRAGLRSGAVEQGLALAPMVQVLELMLQEEGRADGERTRLLGHLHEVFISQLVRALQMRVAEGESTLYRRAIELIQTRFRALHSLEEMAARLGCRSETLCRHFQQRHGQSPYQTLLQYKMADAFAQMRDTGRSVKEVAASVGFEDPLHFSRVFKRVIGLAPTHCRSRMSQSLRFED